MKTAAAGVAAPLLALQTSGVAAGGAQTKAKTQKLDIQTLSTHADRVTGGEVLIAIAMPAGSAASAPPPEVRLNGRDVSSAFRVQDRRSSTGSRPNGVRPRPSTAAGRNTTAARRYLSASGRHSAAIL